MPVELFAITLRESYFSLSVPVLGNLSFLRSTAQAYALIDTSWQTVALQAKALHCPLSIARGVHPRILGNHSTLSENQGLAVNVGKCLQGKFLFLNKGKSN